MSDRVLNFQEDVIGASHTRPVVVDFWAPWCGPCRVLGPILDRLAAEQSNRWTLVKVNSDEHPELSSRYDIRGIPAVKMFVDGVVVDEFTGALPEHAVRQWLDSAIPSEADTRLTHAASLIEAGQTALAIPILESILQIAPLHPGATASLASLLVFGDPDRAIELASAARNGDPTSIMIAEAVSLVATAIQGLPETLPDGPGKEIYEKALEDLREENLDAAIEGLIHVLQVDRYYLDDRARKMCVALFTVLGEGHELTRKHRRTFEMWLY